MPCEYYTSDEIIRDLRADNTKLTQLLCRLCFCLEASNAFPNLLDVKAWWEEHKARDARRADLAAKQAEASASRKEAIEAVLAKLSPAERQLINAKPHY